ncbi:hypothetical protein [Thaumasiovibrio subtropicus]|uniref:hypothetical protein n=1 Tax=Thaumasiovibrio subtropicus TaxID=1891207 RepID=UPI00131E60C5|nr:hypothetical protein [Thaumasiovibrio subtropicus]
MKQRNMRHRLRTYLLCLIFAVPLGAKELTPQQVSAVLNSDQLANALAGLSFVFNQSDISRLESHLNTLHPREKEAAKLMLVDYAATLPDLSPEQLAWLYQLSTEHPTYSVKSQGDGYVVSMRAFNYGLLAHGVVTDWQHQQEADAIFAQLEAGELTLTEWLKVPLTDYYPRRDTFLSRVDSMSPEAIELMVAEFGPKMNRMLWLPDNAVIAALAARSGNEALHGLLWRRRTDAFSLDELQRLANLAPDGYAVEQLIIATGNPSLKSSAYQQLARLQPMPFDVQHFLIAKLDEVEDGGLVANQLATQGYRDWISELAQGENSTIRARHLQQALSSTAP